jgi:hypothetical protein
MRRSRHNREPEVDPFYDMFFNMLIAFVFCFIIALLAMNPKTTKAGDIPAKAEYIITLSWPDLDPNDIDLWVQNPQGNTVFYREREAGLMHLDRDDRGLSNDTILVNGRKIVNPLNQEVVTIRGIAPGEYVINAHYFESKEVDSTNPRAGQPVEVNVAVVKVNPRAEVVFYGKHLLQGRGEEATLARFTVLSDGAITDINTLAKKLVGSNTK